MNGMNKGGNLFDEGILNLVLWIAFILIVISGIVWLVKTLTG